MGQIIKITKVIFTFCDRDEMKIKLNFTLALIYLNCLASAANAGNLCDIPKLIDINYYFNQSYMRIPGEIRAVAPGGNVKGEKIWEVLGANLDKLKTHESNLDGVIFGVFKNKIYRVSLYIKDDALSSGRVSISDILDNCGVRVGASCSSAGDGFVIMANAENNLTIFNSRLSRKIYGFPFDANHSCN